MLDDRLTTDELADVLHALAPAPSVYVDMAAIHFNVDPSPDGWCELTSAEGRELRSRLLERFGQRTPRP
jgi:hypothetical protein